jgi:hypothetical protein
MENVLLFCIENIHFATIEMQHFGFYRYAEQPIEVPWVVMYLTFTISISFGGNHILLQILM